MIVSRWGHPYFILFQRGSHVIFHPLLFEFHVLIDPHEEIGQPSVVVVPHWGHLIFLNTFSKGVACKSIKKALFCKLFEISVNNGRMNI